MALRISPSKVVSLSGGLQVSRRGVSFNPASISGLQLWLDAISSAKWQDAARTTPAVADADPIAAWDDLSGLNRGPAAGAGAVRPFYKPAAVSGRGALRFDGVDDFLKSASFARAQPYTLYLAFSFVSGAPQNGRIVDGNTVNEAVVNRSMALYAGTAFAPTLSTGGSMGGVGVGVTNVATAVFNGASSTISLNSAAPVTGNPGAGGINAGLCFGSAGNQAANNFANVDLAAVLLYSGVHSAGTRLQVENYLKSRYAVGAGVNPQIIFDGDSLTFGQGSTGGQTYPVQALALLGGNWDNQNFGVSGQTVVQMASDAVGQLDVLVANLRPRNILCAWGGTNDLVGGAIDTTTYNNIVSYCQGRQAAGYKVVALTILPRTGGSPPANFETYRLSVNTSMRANWATFADVLADVGNDATIGVTGAPSNTTYYADQIHLTNAGYAIVAGIVTTAVQSL